MHVHVFLYGIKDVRDVLTQKILSPPIKFLQNQVILVRDSEIFLWAVGLPCFKWRTIRSIRLDWSAYYFLLPSLRPHLFSSLHYLVQYPGSDLYASITKVPLPKGFQLDWANRRYLQESRGQEDTVRECCDCQRLIPKLELEAINTQFFKAEWDQGKLDGSRQDFWRCEGFLWALKNG